MKMILICEGPWHCFCWRETLPSPEEGKVFGLSVLGFKMNSIFLSSWCWAEQGLFFRFPLKRTGTVKVYAVLHKRILINGLLQVCDWMSRTLCLSQCCARNHEFLSPYRPVSLCPSIYPSFLRSLCLFFRLPTCPSVHLLFISDIDECLAQCQGENTVCMNQAGTFSCTCKTGYSGNALSAEGCQRGEISHAILA